MKLKMKLLPAVLLTAVLLAGCSKADDIPDTASDTSNAADTSDISSTADISDTSYEDDTDSEEEIRSMEGYYLRTEFVDMIIREQSFTAQDGSAETIYEPIEIYFGEDEEGDVPFDSLKTGDKIEADVKLIAETHPGQARIYGLRLIESGDVSNINDEELLRLEELGRHAVIGEKTEQPPITRHSGYFVRTEKGCFLIPSEEYGMLSGIDNLNISPASEASNVSLDAFNTCDRIWIDIMTVQELYPPVAPLYGAVLIENGDISNIDNAAASKREELGYSVAE